MTRTPADLLDPGLWPVLVLASSRVGGLFLVAPLWSMASIPPRLRAAMALVLTAALLPAAPALSSPLAPGMMAVHLVIEGVIGLAIGLTAAVFLHGVAVAAEVLSLQMGLSLGASFSPLAEITVPGLGELKGFMVLALYTTLGGHLALVRALGASLRTLPLGGEVDVVAGAQGLVALAGTVFVVAIRAAAPLLVALFVTHLALAILNRAVPQLNTIMVSVPVTVGIGLLLLGAAVPITAQYVAEWVGGIESAAQTILVPFHLSPGR